MNWTRAAIEKNRVTIVAIIVLVFSGMNAYRTMPRAEDPGFTIRVALVVTYFPGASPRRVEELVTDRIEKVVQQMPELDFVSSESKPGVSLIYVNIKSEYKEMRPIWDDLRRKVDSARSELPEGVSGPFVNDEFGDVFGTVLMLTGEGYNYAELKEIADDVREEVLLLDEVGKVDIHGVQEERVFVEYNNARLAELGLSPAQLAGILETRNIVIPGGSINTADLRERIDLEPTGNFDSVEELRRTVIKVPGSQQLLYLEDVAHVQRGYVDPPESMAHYNGDPALAIAINLRDGGNIITLGGEVAALVDRIRSQYPIGVEFDFVSFQADHVDKKVKDFSISLLQAIVIVLVVMLFTLGVRTGLVVASLIPIAMIGGLLIMSLFDIGLDQMSLAALIISLGMLVDNSIVMSESIMVMIAEGKKPIQAAIDSASELRIPLLISSLTTSAAFLPIYLAESDVGEYTAPLFKVVTITLLTSWVLSLTMIPMFCVSFLKVKKKTNEASFNSRFYRGYRSFLLAIIRRPLLTILGIIALFALAMFGFRFLPNIFFPGNDKAIFTVEMELPTGTPIEQTERVVQGVEAFMRETLVAGPEQSEGIQDWATFIGAGAPRFVLTYNPEPAKPEYAMMLVNATSYEVIVESMARLRKFITDNYPDVIAAIDYLGLGPAADAPVEIRVSGRDESKLFEIVDQVKTDLAAIPGTRSITDNWGPRTKKLLVQVNQPRARRAGLTSRDVAISLQTVLTGLETTEYREEDEIIPVVLRSVAADRHDLGKLESHNIYVQSTGQSVPLKQVADIEVVWQPSKILRRDRVKTVTVQADIESFVTPIAVALEADEKLQQQASWGIGYKYELGGEMENSVEANQSIMAKLPIAGFIIVLLLVSQFNSILRPVIILLTIPLGVIGVTFGLLVGRSYFGFMTLLGIISLAGIVINNAIVLIERIKIEIEENGLEPQRAILEAAQRRLRPILLTTATTVGGLIPLWVGGGPMWEPMAISIIFGLLFATTLTLGLVPVLYSIFFRVKFKGFEY